jgi:hypothetical protein
VPQETVTLLLEGDHVAVYDSILSRLDEVALSERDSATLIVSLTGQQARERGLTVMPYPEDIPVEAG